VAAYVLHVPMREVSIVPDEANGTAGHMAAANALWFHPDYEDDARTVRRAEADIMVTLAGPAAEARWAGRRNHRGAKGDYRDAVDMADHMTGDNKGTELYLAWLRYRAEGLVQRVHYWAAIEALAAELLAQRRLGARRTRAVVKAGIAAWFASIARRPVGEGA
jgi:hypothetical protein